MEKTVKDITIEIVQGDITELEVDAIVNAANNHMWMGGGVAGAIKRKGGREIEDEAVRKGPVEVGEAVVTRAEKLKANYVIHAAGMGVDGTCNSKSVSDSTRNSLKRAEEIGIKSIAFPAIGTGIGGFPAEEAADLMIKAAVDHIKAGTKIKRIVFALFDGNTYKIFENKLNECGK